MANWRLAKSLEKLRKQINAASPSGCGGGSRRLGGAFPPCCPLSRQTSPLSYRGARQTKSIAAGVAFICKRVTVGAVGFCRVRIGYAITASKVLLHRDGLKVGWVNARRIAAKVVNGKPLGDWAIGKFVGDPMSAQLAAKPSAFSDSPVARLLSYACPLPTLALWPVARRLVNVLPKTDLKGLACSDIVTSRHDLNLQYRLGLCVGSRTADNGSRAACILA